MNALKTYTAFEWFVVAGFLLLSMLFSEWGPLFLAVVLGVFWLGRSRRAGER